MRKMRKRFCCDANRALYENYYISQSGNGIPVFEGHRGQRGHGLGSMLSGLFRGAVPMLKKGLSIFGRQALRTGLDMVNDVVEGKSFRDSARERLPEGLRAGIGEGIKSIREAMPGLSDQSGSGRLRAILLGKKRKRVKKVVKKKKKKSCGSDIFS